MRARKCDDLVGPGSRRRIVGDRGEARVTVTQQREHPSRTHHHFADHAQVGSEFVREASVCLARARRAHRHVERESEDLGFNRLRTPNQIETDLVVVMPEPIELQPEHIGRSFSSLFDGGAAGDAERVGNARTLRRFCHQQIGARPHQRRPAHGRNADRRRIVSPEQFDVDWRQSGHHPVARRDLDGIKCRPVVGNTDVVPRAGIAIFEGEQRHVVRRATAQPGAGRKMLMVFLKIRMLANWCHRRFFRRHVVHGEVPFFDFIIAARDMSVPSQK